MNDNLNFIHFFHFFFKVYSYIVRLAKCMHSQQARIFKIASNFLKCRIISARQTEDRVEHEPMDWALLAVFGFQYKYNYLTIQWDTARNLHEKLGWTLSGESPTRYKFQKTAIDSRAINQVSRDRINSRVLLVSRTSILEQYQANTLHAILQWMKLDFPVFISFIEIPISANMHAFLFPFFQQKKNLIFYTIHWISIYNLLNCFHVRKNH